MTLFVRAKLAQLNKQALDPIPLMPPGGGSTTLGGSARNGVNMALSGARNQLNAAGSLGSGAMSTLGGGLRSAFSSPVAQRQPAAPVAPAAPTTPAAPAAPSAVPASRTPATLATPASSPSVSYKAPVTGRQPTSSGFRALQAVTNPLTYANVGTQALFSNLRGTAYNAGSSLPGPLGAAAKGLFGGGGGGNSNFQHRFENDPEFRSAQFAKQRAKAYEDMQTNLKKYRESRKAYRGGESPYMKNYNPQTYSNTISYR